MLDGLGRVKALAQRARELGMPALALTDHGVMYGAIEFFDACHDVGIKPIIGIEAYLSKRGRPMQSRDATLDRSPYHLLLLAQDNEGYLNLIHLASLAQIEGFYYKPRIDHEALAKYSAGVLCTSGCPSSEIPRLVLNGHVDEARQAAQWYRDVFGDRFFFELQEHDQPEFAPINTTLVQWSREMAVPLVATNDVHYVMKEDASAHDLMLCIQTNALYADARRMRMNNDSYYLKSEEEMHALFDSIAPEAISNTERLAERCSVSLKSKQFHLPNFQRPREYPSAEDYLRALCAKGFQERYGVPSEPDSAGEADDEPIDLTQRSPLALPGSAHNPNLRPSALRQRLQYELGVIIEMGFATYFLIVWDLIRFARENNIWWNVRGSAAGSVVSYVLGLTNIEPVSNELLFERFLNPGRVSMPDIDLDFPDDQRNRLVDYTIEKYGKEQVAQIITFGTMAARAALKDVGRVLDLPVGEVTRMTSLVPAIPGKPVGLKEALDQVPDLRALYDGEDHLRDLYDKAELVEGTVRNAGTHAAGVVIADKPLIEYVPLHRLTGTPLSSALNAITQFEMTHLESIGLLKMDYLGLSMLTIMRKACELIERRHGTRYTLDSIPIHDPVIYQTLSRGDVMGVFQVEGTGFRNLMLQMKPTRFEHIVAAVALFRPGPMEQIPTYIARMHGDQPVEYHHPDLAPALEETFGIITYQEQVMRVARDIAGYSMGEADTIRKAVAKKNAEALMKHKTKFREGAVNKGYAAELADAIFGDIESFARYGFVKAHAADYAQIACQTAYLKAKYPTEYMAALMTCEAGNTDKIAGLVADTKGHGIDILPPSINYSFADFTIEDVIQESAGSNQQASSNIPQAASKSVSKIRYGLMAIKNVGQGPIDAIVKARQAGGLFKTLDDFCRRVDMTQVNKRALESLIKVGAFDAFGPRHQLLAVIDVMVGLASQARRAAERGQFMMFDAFGVGDESLIALPAHVKEIPRRDLLSYEKELAGTYVSEHPLAAAMSSLRDIITHTSAQLNEGDNGQKVVLAGVITMVRPHVSKSGKSMAFAELEDLYGRVELTIFPRTWDEYRDTIQRDKVVVVWGKAEVREGGTPKLLVERVRDNLTRAFSTDAVSTGERTGAPSGAVAPAALEQVGDTVSHQVYEESAPYTGAPAYGAPEYGWIEESAAASDAAPGMYSESATGDLYNDVHTDSPQSGSDALVNAESGALRDEALSSIPREDELKHHVEQGDAMSTQHHEPQAEIGAADISSPTGDSLAQDAQKHTSQERDNELEDVVTRLSDQLTVVIHRCGDVTQDVARLEAVHQVLVQFKGEQRFSIRLRNTGRRDVTLDFPNDTTYDCVELRHKLVALGAFIP